MHGHREKIVIFGGSLLKAHLPVDVNHSLLFLFSVKYCLSLSLNLSEERMARKMGEEGNPSVQSPLIPSYDKSLESRGGERLNNVDWKRDIADEVKKQLWLAGPLVAVSFLQFCLQTISVMFVGHLGELSLSSASMATSFAGVTGFSFLVYLLLSFSLKIYLLTSPLCT